MMSTGKWTPQGPIRPQNCIDSSFAALKHNFGFRPQYEYEKKVHIGYLLSFEYQRMWLKEREIYEKEFYAKPAPKGNNAILVFILSKINVPSQTGNVDVKCQ